MNKEAHRRKPAGVSAVKSWTIAVCAMSLCATSATSADTDPASSTDIASATIPSPLPLDWCLDRARSANPALALAAARAAADAERVESTSSFEDPRFSYEASNLPTGDFDFKSTPLSGHQLGLRQMFPFPGLLAKREDAAQQHAKASELLVEDQREWIESAVEMAWAELGFAQQAGEITGRNIELMRQLSAAAESRYRVGDGLQQDVLRAQVELTELLRERLRRSEAVELSSSKLATLLDLPPLTQFPRTLQVGVLNVVPSLATLIEFMAESNPRIAAAEQRMQEARTRIEIAETEGLPDFDLGIGYRARRNVPGDPVRGDDFVSAGLTVRMPVNRSKWRARVAEQVARLREAEADLRGIRSMLAHETRSAYAALLRALSEEELLDSGLLPLATQSLEAGRSAYQVGRIDFLTLLDSQVRLLDAELRLARARADKRLAYAALERAAGRRLR